MTEEEWNKLCQDEMLEIGKIDLKNILKDNVELDDIIDYIQVKSNYKLPCHLKREQILQYLQQTYHIKFYSYVMYFVDKGVE